MSRQCHTPGKRSYPTRAAALAALRAPFTGLYAPYGSIAADVANTT